MHCHRPFLQLPLTPSILYAHLPSDILKLWQWLNEFEEEDDPSELGKDQVGWMEYRFGQLRVDSLDEDEAAEESLHSHWSIIKVQKTHPQPHTLLLVIFTTAISFRNHQSFLLYHMPFLPWSIGLSNRGWIPQVRMKRLSRLCTATGLP
jgi:hypothetical protein